MASRLLVVGLGISATVVGIDFFKDNLNDWIQSNMITEEERNRNFREHMGRMRERCDKKLEEWESPSKPLSSWTFASKLSKYHKDSSLKEKDSNGFVALREEMSGASTS